MPTERKSRSSAPSRGALSDDGNGRGIILALAFTSIGAPLGYVQFGPFGALLGALLGGALGLALHSTWRAFSVHRQLEGPRPPDVRALPPDKALQVLSAVAGVGGSAGLVSEVVRKVTEVEALAERDLHAAIVECEELRQAHPIAPAIPAALARLELRRDREDAAARAAGQAIALAIRGGMNALAVRLYDEFESLRARLELDRATRDGLARALSARGDVEAARWWMEREPD